VLDGRTPFGDDAVEVGGCGLHPRDGVGVEPVLEVEGEDCGARGGHGLPRFELEREDWREGLAAALKASRDRLSCRAATAMRRGDVGRAAGRPYRAVSFLGRDRDAKRAGPGVALEKGADHVVPGRRQKGGP